MAIFVFNKTIYRLSGSVYSEIGSSSGIFGEDAAETGFPFFPGKKDRPKSKFVPQDPVVGEAGMFAVVIDGHTPGDELAMHVADFTKMRGQSLRNLQLPHNARGSMQRAFCE